MKGKQAMGFAKLYVGIVIVMLVPTIMTLWPAQASKLNRLGYMSICTFAPWSTLGMAVITLLAMGGVYLIQRIVAK